MRSVTAEAITVLVDSSLWVEQLAVPVRPLCEDPRQSLRHPLERMTSLAVVKERPAGTDPMELQNHLSVVPCEVLRVRRDEARTRFCACAG